MMRPLSPAHAAFAATMIALGLIGLISGDFAPVLSGVPGDMPGREALACAGALLLLGAGLGLVWRRTAALCALVLLAAFLLWLLLVKGRFILIAPLQEASYQSAGETTVMAAAAWVLLHRLAGGWRRPGLALLAGDTGLRIAKSLYGLALIAFGFSHFVYLDLTAPLVPAWLGWPVGWAYFTGGAYLAAGAAILAGRRARFAAVLVAVQIGLITLLVWGPMLVAGGMTAMHWRETVVSVALTAAAWVLAEFRRGDRGLVGADGLEPPTRTV